MELIHEKVLTAENLKKRNIYGPSHHALCEQEEEHIPHLFRKFSYDLEVWKHALYALVCLVCTRMHKLRLNTKSPDQNIRHSNRFETIIALFSMFSCFFSSKVSQILLKSFTKINFWIWLMALPMSYIYKISILYWCLYYCYSRYTRRFSIIIKFPKRIKWLWVA